jgi:hypothetical protein
MAHPHSPPQAPPDDAGGPPAAWPLGRCPLCGALPLPWDAKVSAVLDWVVTIEDAVRDLRRAAEDLVA